MLFFTLVEISFLNQTSQLEKKEPILYNKRREIKLRSPDKEDQQFVLALQQHCNIPYEIGSMKPKRKFRSNDIHIFWKKKKKTITKKIAYMTILLVSRCHQLISLLNQPSFLSFYIILIFI